MERFGEFQSSEGIDSGKELGTKLSKIFGENGGEKMKIGIPYLERVKLAIQHSGMTEITTKDGKTVFSIEELLENIENAEQQARRLSASERTDDKMDQILADCGVTSSHEIRKYAVRALIEDLAGTESTAVLLKDLEKRIQTLQRPRGTRFPGSQCDWLIGILKEGKKNGLTQIMTSNGKEAIPIDTLIRDMTQVSNWVTEEYGNIPLSSLRNRQTQISDEIDAKAAENSITSSHGIRSAFVWFAIQDLLVKAGKKS